MQLLELKERLRKIELEKDEIDKKRREMEQGSFLKNVAIQANIK